MCIFDGGGISFGEAIVAVAICKTVFAYVGDGDDYNDDCESGCDGSGGGFRCGDSGGCDGGSRSSYET